MHLALSMRCLVIFKASMQHTNVIWRQSLYQSCRARRDIQLCSWGFFHLKLFKVHKLCFKFSEFWNSNVWIFKRPQMETQPKQKLQYSTRYKTFQFNFFFIWNCLTRCLWCRLLRGIWGLRSQGFRQRRFVLGRRLHNKSNKLCEILYFI